MQKHLNEKHELLKKERHSKRKSICNIPSFTFSDPPINFTEYKNSFVYVYKSRI
jgi:hypothetical protein